MLSENFRQKKSGAWVKARRVYIFVVVCALFLDFMTIPASSTAESRNIDEQLLSSVEKCDLESVKSLLENGADPNFRNQKEETLLILARWCDTSLVKLLLDKGADPNLRGPYGLRAAIFVAFRGNLELMKYLIEKGADINAKADSDSTILMFAAAGGSLEMVQFLVEKGMDVNAKSKQGKTALMYAAGFGRSSIMQYLRSEGAVGPTFIRPHGFNEELPDSRSLSHD